MSTKVSRYSELVEEVRKCEKCMIDQKTQGTRLVQDKCRSQINLWSHWQGSLNAKILVIGQDWGEKPDAESYDKWTTDPTYPSLTGIHKQIPKYKFKTDNNLADICREALGLDLHINQKSLFFTNAVLCYRDKGFTGAVDPRWFKNCQPFCVRLINIIKPQAIVTLGSMPLRALLDGGSLSYDSKFKDLGKKLKTSRSMREIVETHEQLYYRPEGLDLTIKVFPVFHCGSWGTKARSMEEQVMDWGEIRQQI